MQNFSTPQTILRAPIVKNPNNLSNSNNGNPALLLTSLNNTTATIMPAAEKAPSPSNAVQAAIKAKQQQAPKNGALIQDHYNKASSVCGHIDDLVAALTELYEDNAKWKQKYINAKKSHFSKFFGASSTMLIGNTFREWKRWSFECESERKIVNLQHDLDDQKKNYEKQLAQLEDMHEKRLLQLEQSHQATCTDLQDQISQKNAKLDALQKEKNTVQKKADKIYKVLQSLKGQLTDLEDEDPNVLEETVKSAQVLAQDPNNFDFLKNRLHDLLNQIDPKYVPPLGSLSLMPPPQPLSATSTGSYAPAVSQQSQPKTLQAPGLSMPGLMH